MVNVVWRCFYVAVAADGHCFDVDVWENSKGRQMLKNDVLLKMFSSNSSL